MRRFSFLVRHLANVLQSDLVKNGMKYVELRYFRFAQNLFRAKATWTERDDFFKSHLLLMLPHPTIEPEVSRPSRSKV